MWAWTRSGGRNSETALAALGELLAARGLHYEVVLVGGGNLILRELINRPTTKDLDILGERTAEGVTPIRPLPRATSRCGHRCRTHVWSCR